MGIREDLISEIQHFNRTHNGEEPAKIYLTPDDELALASMSLDEAGGAVTGKVREDYRSFSGLVAVWDSDVRRCE